MITIDDFAKVEIRVGMVVEAVEIEGSEKLLKLQVNFGEEKTRQVLSGIKKWYKPTQLIGKQFVFVTNLEPRQMMGLESQGMILCCGGDPPTGPASGGAGGPIPLKPSKKVPNGSKIR